MLPSLLLCLRLPYCIALALRDMHSTSEWSINPSQAELKVDAGPYENFRILWGSGFKGSGSAFATWFLAEGQWCSPASASRSVSRSLCSMNDQRGFGSFGLRFGVKGLPFVV